MRTGADTNRLRVRAAVGVALLEALLGYALIVGLRGTHGLPPAEPLRIFGIAPPPPPPPKKKPKPPPPRTRSANPEGAAAPPNLRATPTEIVRPPPPPIPLPLPPPVAASPIAGVGAAPSAGAAPVPGPGTGAGGEGNGTGSGLGGNGTGGGGNGGGGFRGGSPPRHIKGRIKDRDYPASARAMGAQGTVEVRYTVRVDGRVSNCRILRSSGNGDIDQTTCRVIEERFRFKPAKDERGQPVQADLVEKHGWFMREGDAPPDDDPE